MFELKYMYIYIISTTVILQPEVDALIANPTDPNVLDALKTQLEEVQRLADSTNRNVRAENGLQLDVLL